MTIFATSYDLIKRKNYPDLWEALKKQGAHRVLDSVWLVSANNTATEVRDWLATFVDSDDKIMVAQTTKASLKFTLANPGTSDWLARNS